MKKTDVLRMVLPVIGLFLATVTQPHAQSVSYSPGPQWDGLVWKTFAAAVTPANGGLTFETWATDADTFPPVGQRPQWPTGLTLVQGNTRFHPSFLGRAHLPNGLAAIAGPGGLPPCSSPPDPNAGRFPPQNGQPASPSYCIAEEVRRNRPSFEYIARHDLYNTPLMAQAYAKNVTVQFPKTAIELKADWVPVPTIATWLNDNGVQVNGAPVTDAWVQANYALTTVSGVQYGLVAIHISTKDLPNWVWSTFEHQMNPGRCDTMGCYDRFGIVPASNAAIPPNPVANGQYPACTKSPALQRLLAKAGASAVWNNYCLKETQIDFTSTQAASKGQPVLDGNSVTERINAAVPIAQASCISCHDWARFSKSGAFYGGSSNPGLSTPAPIGAVSAPADAHSYDFVWGLIAQH